VILPWLMERGSATLAEMSERFQLTEAELVRDLEQVSMCGLPPYLDEMVDLFIDDDGTVNIGVPRFFTSSLRLTAPEGFELLAAGRLAMALPGADPEGPLGRALTKLETLLGDDPMSIDVDRPPATSDLVAAAAAGERVEIAYWSASSDRTSERTIVPLVVFADRGRWYVQADDGASGEERCFRVDRIDRWRRTGEHVPVRTAEAAAPGRWFEDDDLPVATLVIGPGGRWAVEQLPTRSVTVRGDELEVELAVASEAWLAELLLRLGPSAVVTSPPELVDMAARRASELLRARYAVTS
jgi:proteasome accessory factor C